VNQFLENINNQISYIGEIDIPNRLVLKKLISNYPCYKNQNYSPNNLKKK
jgi:hypothetical protein